ncbi:CarD family transcriptional regulator [Alkalibacillus aidingensis]|uniref:CarD family transcriptional regulator n=1 Tax=Alkalibacillus aidingensis TaxID=2747607 RepID=UPI001661784A|nr:CarD family transcriptional regulator [Alkalibacillus aidingensis]
MLNIGDLVVYTGHGICRVDDICDKNLFGMKKTYYILHPLENNHQLTINTPIDNDQISMLQLVNQQEAEKILHSFNSDGYDWIERPNLRTQHFTKTLDTGDRMKVAKVVNTLLRKNHELKQKEQKLHANDSKLLNETQNVLFKELSIALKTSTEEIAKKVYRNIGACHSSNFVE